LYVNCTAIKIKKKELAKLEKDLIKSKENFIELSKLNDKFLKLEDNKVKIDELMLENIDNDYFFGNDLESLYYLSENYKKLVEIYLKILL